MFGDINALFARSGYRLHFGEVASTSILMCMCHWVAFNDYSEKAHKNTARIRQATKVCRFLQSTDEQD
jgi:hypothetical protein